MVSLRLFFFSVGYSGSGYSVRQCADPSLEFYSDVYPYPLQNVCAVFWMRTTCVYKCVVVVVRFDTSSSDHPYRNRTATRDKKRHTWFEIGHAVLDFILLYTMLRNLLRVFMPNRVRTFRVLFFRSPLRPLKLLMMPYTYYFFVINGARGGNIKYHKCLF